MCTPLSLNYTYIYMERVKYCYKDKREFVSFAHLFDTLSKQFQSQIMVTNNNAQSRQKFKENYVNYMKKKKKKQKKKKKKKKKTRNYGGKCFFS